MKDKYTYIQKCDYCKKEFKTKHYQVGCVKCGSIDRCHIKQINKHKQRGELSPRINKRKREYKNVIK